MEGNAKIQNKQKELLEIIDEIEEKIKGRGLEIIEYKTGSIGLCKPK